MPRRTPTVVRTIALPLTLLITALPAATATAAPRRADRARLQRALDAVVRGGAPAAIALVRDGRNTMRLAGGHGELATRRPMRPHDRVRATTLRPGPRIAGRHAHGYTRYGGGRRPLDITDIGQSFARAAGALVSTTDDLRAQTAISRLTELAYCGGRLGLGAPVARAAAQRGAAPSARRYVCVASTSSPGDRVRSYNAPSSSDA